MGTGGAQGHEASRGKERQTLAVIAKAEEQYERGRVERIRTWDMLTLLSAARHAYSDMPLSVNGIEWLLEDMQMPTRVRVRCIRDARHGALHERV